MRTAVEKSRINITRNVLTHEGPERYVSCLARHYFDTARKIRWSYVCDFYQNALSFDYLNLLLTNFSTKDYDGFFIVSLGNGNQAICIENSLLDIFEHIPAMISFVYDGKVYEETHMH